MKGSLLKFCKNPFQIVKFFFFLIIFLISFKTYSANFFTTGAGGNWGSSSTWASSCGGAGGAGVPGSGDNVTICGAVTITVDGNYFCNNFSLGDGVSNAATVQITSSSNSLTIGGTLQINSNNNANTYILDAGPGTINVNGTFPTWGTGGTNNIKVSTGTITFVPLVTINSAAQFITFTSAGIINFNSGLTSNQSPATNFVTVSGCTINFGGTLTWTLGGNWTLNTNSTEVFTGASNINTSGGGLNLTLGNVVIYNGATVSTAGNGGLSIQGNLTLNASASFTTTKALSGIFGGIGIRDVTLNNGSTFTLGGACPVVGNWTNNGGTLNAVTYGVQFDGQGMSIGGTSSTTFYTLQIGQTGNRAVSTTLNQNVSCNNFIINAHGTLSSAYTRTFTQSSGVSLTISADATITQPNDDAATNQWNVAGGNTTIGGNLIFSGTSNTASRVAKINITSGSFSLSGNVTWMAQGATKEVATEVISLSNGTLTFSNSLAMDQGSGTLNITGNGTVNFNGTTAPSFNLNSTIASSLNAVFSNAGGSTINFAKGFTNANASVVFADGSNAVFTGTGTISPFAPITFGNFNLSGGTCTLAGNISVSGNWTDNGTFTPATNSVTFNGTGTQSISRTGGETFYGLITNTTGPLIFSSDVLVTNTLTMTGGNYNLNGQTLTLGNSAGATLVHSLAASAGIMYGAGIFKRWFPATAISSTTGSLEGFFPLGTATDMSQIEINSTLNPVTPGYVSASHTEALTVTDVTYTDNESASIQRIHDTKAIISTIGLAGGQYNLSITYSILSSTGNLTDMKLETYSGSLMGSVGTSAATAGTVPAPTVKRTLLNDADLANDWVLGTINKTNTPLRAIYYSIASGNWATAGVWSYTNGGTSCGCTPVNDGYAIITSAGSPVSVNAPATIDFVDVNTSAILNGASNFTVNFDLTTNGTGVFTPTSGNYSVGRNVTLNGTGSSNTPSGTTSITGDLTLSSGTTLTLGAGLTLTGSITNNGTLAAGANNITLNGLAKNITGSSAISGSGTITLTNNKTILAGSSITIGPSVNLSTGTTVTNNGMVTLSQTKPSDLTGTDATSVWTNSTNSTLKVAGAVLTTGTLNASATSNTVEYFFGNQNIKVPSSGYYNLIASNPSGGASKTKTVTASIVVANTLSIADDAIVAEGSNVISGGGGLTMSGTSQLTLSRTTAVTIPELTGTYNLSGGTISLSSTGGGQTLRGVSYYNLSVSGNFPITTTYLSSVTNNLTWSNSGGSALGNNLTVGGIFTLTLGGLTESNFAVNVGSFSQSGGTFSQNTGVFTVNNNISGSSWSRTGGMFNANTGTVIFNGIMAQTISGTASTTFNNLTINNSSTTGVTLTKDATVNTNLTLTDGYLYTSASPNGLLSLIDNATCINASAASFVDGPIKKIGNDAFIFPTGDDKAPVGFGTEDKWARIGITAPANATTEYTARYTGIGYGSYSVLSPLNNVSGLEYWDLDQAVNNDDVQVKLYWEDYAFSGINDCGTSDLRVAHWNSVSSRWELDVDGTNVSGGCTGGSLSGTVQTNAAQPNFSPFTFGSKSTVVNPLPVELISFDAELIETSVKLNWITASENNNDYFTIEKSPDGINFILLDTVDGSGTSSTVSNYNAIDKNPYTGVSYYRLKQTDFNGLTSQLKTVSVNFEGVEIIRTYPNPAEAEVKFLINTYEDMYATYSIYDIRGGKVKSERMFFSKGFTNLAIDISGLSESLFIFKIISDDNKYYSRKHFVKTTSH